LIEEKIIRMLFLKLDFVVAMTVDVILGISKWHTSECSKER
jgi:hypothetical protein